MLTKLGADAKSSYLFRPNEEHSQQAATYIEADHVERLFSLNQALTHVKTLGRPAVS